MFEKENSAKKCVIKCLNCGNETFYIRNIWSHKNGDIELPIFATSLFGGDFSLIPHICEECDFVMIFTMDKSI